MKIYAYAAAAFLFLNGCSIYNTKMGVENINAPDASTQLLRNTPLVSSAKSAVFFNKNNTDEIMNSLSGADKDRNFAVINKDGETVVFAGGQIDKFLGNVRAVTEGKIFVEVHGCQTYAGQITANLFKAGASTIMTEANLRFDEKRRELLRLLIEDELADKGFTVSKNEKEADYRMRVIVLEDGMTAKTTIGVLYMVKRKTGIVALDIDIISTADNKIAASYKTKNSCYLKSTSILYFIPVHNSSVNFDAEF